MDHQESEKSEACGEENDSDNAYQQNWNEIQIKKREDKILKRKIDIMEYSIKLQKYESVENAVVTAIKENNDIPSAMSYKQFPIQPGESLLKTAVIGRLREIKEEIKDTDNVSNLFDSESLNLSPQNFYSSSETSVSASIPTCQVKKVAIKRKATEFQPNASIFENNQMSFLNSAGEPLPSTSKMHTFPLAQNRKITNEYLEKYFSKRKDANVASTIMPNCSKMNANSVAQKRKISNEPLNESFTKKKDTFLNIPEASCSKMHINLDEQKRKIANKQLKEYFAKRKNASANVVTSLRAISSNLETGAQKRKITNEHLKTRKVSDNHLADYFEYNTDALTLLANTASSYEPIPSCLKLHTEPVENKNHFIDYFAVSSSTPTNKTNAVESTSGLPMMNTEPVSKKRKVSSNHLKDYIVGYTNVNIEINLPTRGRPPREKKPKQKIDKDFIKKPQVKLRKTKNQAKNELPDLTKIASNGRVRTVPPVRRESNNDPPKTAKSKNKSEMKETAMNQSKATKNKNKPSSSNKNVEKKKQVAKSSNKKNKKQNQVAVPVPSTSRDNLTAPIQNEVSPPYTAARMYAQNASRPTNTYLDQYVTFTNQTAATNIAPPPSRSLRSNIKLGKPQPSILKRHLTTKITEPKKSIRKPKNEEQPVIVEQIAETVNSEDYEFFDIELEIAIKPVTMHDFHNVIDMYLLNIEEQLLEELRKIKFENPEEFGVIFHIQIEEYLLDNEFLEIIISEGPLFMWSDDSIICSNDWLSVYEYL